jgi:hypothetical protein
MIINIKNKNDLITLDFILKEIRYLRNTKIKDMYKNVIWDSLKLSNDDISGYEYLFNFNRMLFLKTLIGELKYSMNLDINIYNLHIIELKGGLN